LEQDESATKARRARKHRENEKNAKANAKTRLEESVKSKFEREGTNSSSSSHEQGSRILSFGEGYREGFPQQFENVSNEELQILHPNLHEFFQLICFAHQAGLTRLL